MRTQNSSGQGIGLDPRVNNESDCARATQAHAVDECAKACNEPYVPQLVRELRAQREVLRAQERDVCNKLDTISMLLRVFE